MKLLLFLIITFTLSTHIALADNGYMPPTCDAGLYKAITAKAHLEGQREQMINSNLLFKPDSILEYSCFNVAVGSDLAPKTTDFSADPKSPGATNELLDVPTQQFTDNNFGHAVLGGHGTDPANPASGYSNCSLMNNVWRQAKCGDFQQKPTQTAFANFAEYGEGENKRMLPQECSSNVPLPWNDTLQTVYPPNNLDMNEIYKKMQSGACGDTFIISTGVPLKYKSKQNLNGLTEGKICAAPGCSYDISGKSCN